MLSKYQKPRSIRRDMRTLIGRARGGKLAPVMAVPFLGSESGSLSQSVLYQLDPIAGNMITEITAEIVSVFVPLQAMDAMERDTADFPGNEDALRALIMSGNEVFGTEPENELTKRLGIVPMPKAGVKGVTKAARLAHNCAVNFLRQRKYVKAALLDKNSTAITPAILSQTVLDRLNGVLDPEDRINGKIDFTGQIPVMGLGIKPSTGLASDGAAVVQADGSTTAAGEWNNEMVNTASTGGGLRVHIDPVTSKPLVYADLGGADGISLSDFYQAERMDQLTREMRALVDGNPQFGEELVSRFAYGLSVDVGRQPFVVYEQRVTFSNQFQRATDGASLDVTASNLIARHQFTVPIPATEFGGVVVTFISVKPDETLPSQPHPVFGRSWAPFNFVADELAIDPVPVTAAQINADVAQAGEDTVCLYVGNNELYRNYINYGLSRQLDPSTVENKTAVWQLDIPMSVTPETILYPDDLPHYPFEDQEAEVCIYRIDSSAQINTPIIFGPSPVEELAAIETADVFEDAA